MKLDKYDALVTAGVALVSTANIENIISIIMLLIQILYIIIRLIVGFKKAYEAKDFTEFFKYLEDAKIDLKELKDLVEEKKREKDGK